jgi:NADPH-dependent 7-cyano-7-deazaguanine reductase QueF
MIITYQDKQIVTCPIANDDIRCQITITYAATNRLLELMSLDKYIADLHMASFTAEELAVDIAAACADVLERRVDVTIEAVADSHGPIKVKVTDDPKARDV